MHMKLLFSFSRFCLVVILNLLTVYSGVGKVSKLYGEWDSISSLREKRVTDLEKEKNRMF